MLVPARQNVDPWRLRGRGVTLSLTAYALCLSMLAVLLSFCAGALPANANQTPCDCETCHGVPHGLDFGGCSICHESPPATGSHLVHYDSAPVTAMHYGDTDNASTDEAYRFGCGNCHPIDGARHMDGPVEVELYDPQAPAGSLKAKNPSSAVYDRNSHTCSQIYCHSGYTVTSGAVSSPLRSPPNPVPPGYAVCSGYIMDPTCNRFYYPPYTVTYQRAYTTTPAWGTTGTFGTCAECHAFPSTPSYPNVRAGVGDSHQWIDDWGWADLHGFNHGFGPIPCRTCHYSTLTEDGDRTYGPSDNGIYAPVPIASRVTHINGTRDVAFDTLNGFQYVRSTGVVLNSYYFADATYDPVTRTCSNVGCHREQTTVRWGDPYRYWTIECNLCHSF
jgi:predicted CxxxxCH...CXXCH cytochrome family protein